MLPRSPRLSSDFEIQSSPSTLEKVVQEKEARRAAEEEQRLELLRLARIEHFALRKRMLSGLKGEFLDTMLVLDWSAGANLSKSKTFVHAESRRSAVSVRGTEEEVPEPAMSLSELRQQWVETTCLLRSDLTSERSFEQARRTVPASLDFLDSLSALAAQHASELAGGTGTLFQELLRDLALCGVAGVMIDNLGAGGAEGCLSFEEAAQANALAGQLGHRSAWPLLLRQAQDVRCIVRIKLQDANDLKAAHYALECCSTCFQEIAAHAAKRRVTNFAMALLLESDATE